MNEKIKLFCTDQKMIERIEEITGNDYAIENNNITVNGLLCAIGDLLFEYRRLEEKLNDNTINIRIVK